MDCYGRYTLAMAFRIFCLVGMGGDSGTGEKEEKAITMLISFVALAVIAPPSADLGIVLDKEVYAPGETVRVDVVLRNEGEQSFAIAKARHDGQLSARLVYELWCGERRLWPAVEETSTPALQVMVFNEVTSVRFTELSPGIGTNVGWFEFRAAADEKHSGLKADPRPVPKPLAPGVYELRALYKFVGPFDQYDFTSRAKRLFDMAFKGELKATKTFRVRAGEGMDRHLVASER